MRLYKNDTRDWHEGATEAGFHYCLPRQAIEFWVTGNSLHIEHYQVNRSPQTQAQHRVFKSTDEAIEAGRAFLRACLRQGWSYRGVNE